MKSIIALTICVLATPLAHGQDLPLQLGTPITRDISPGTSHAHAIQANAGDLISGLFELRAASGTLQMRDSRDRTLKSYTFAQPTARPRVVGFVATESGKYDVRVASTGTAGGTYTLRLNVNSAANRMKDHHVQTTETYPSDRIRQLAAQLKAGETGALDDFWKKAAGHGPIIEPMKDSSEDVLVTFLWRQIYETHNVLVGWVSDYYMTKLPDSDVWYKTLRLHRSSRFNYRLSPNDRLEERMLTAQPDPLNPRREEAGPAPSSILELPDAPDETWFRRVPTVRGKVERKTFTSSLLKGDREVFVYTPPGYTATNAYPLVILFDGASYLDPWTGATNTFDNLINDKRIRPSVVCFVNNSTQRDDDLRIGETFGKAMATELLPMLRSSYNIGAVAKDIVLGGFSAGGLAASHIALRHPETFGNVLSQSGAFRQRLAGDSEANSTARMYLNSTRVPVRFYLEAGYYDNMPNARLPLHEMVLDETNLQGNRHLRDVLIAKGYDVTYRETGGTHDLLHWRAMLADGLMALLTPRK